MKGINTVGICMQNAIEHSKRARILCVLGIYKYVDKSGCT
jgi:hypothetical protein